MAVIELNKNSVMTNKAKVENQGVVAVDSNLNKKIILDFYPNRSIRVEVNGNINTLTVNNCATIFGEVGYADVSNSCTCDGRLGPGKAGNRTIYTRNVKVQTTQERIAEERKRRKKLDAELDSFFADFLGPSDSSVPKKESVRMKPSQVVHINGDLESLSIDVVNISCEVIVRGNVKRARADNCLYVKGAIDKYKVGNMMTSNFGVDKK